MALEFVRVADFSCKLMCGAGPGDLGGSRGSPSAENPRKTGPEISSQTAFKYPAKWLALKSTASKPCGGSTEAVGLHGRAARRAR